MPTGESTSGHHSKALNCTRAHTTHAPNSHRVRRSKEAGELLPQTGTSTIADGLRTGLGSLTWPVVRDLVDAIYTVSEEEIKAAMRYDAPVIRFHAACAAQNQHDPRGWVAQARVGADEAGGGAQRGCFARGGAERGLPQGQSRRAPDMRGLLRRQRRPRRLALVRRRFGCVLFLLLLPIRLPTTVRFPPLNWYESKSRSPLLATTWFTQYCHVMVRVLLICSATTWTWLTGYLSGFGCQLTVVSPDTKSQMRATNDDSEPRAPVRSRQHDYSLSSHLETEESRQRREEEEDLT